MYAINFEYDGRYLSDYGYIVCRFDYPSGTNIVDAGSKITFEKVSRNRGKQYSLTNAKYDSCITATFDICKDPDKYDSNEREITSDELRDLMRWLNRKSFHRFQVLYDENRDACFYNASFNIEKITIAEKVYGLRLTMETDSPFGYGKPIVNEITFYDITTDIETPYKEVSYISDEIGYLYPNVEITCGYFGDLTIYNKLGNDDQERCVTYINNCSPNETITIKGPEQIIFTDNNDHDICNDFNWVFFRLENTISDYRNKISLKAKAKANVINYVHYKEVQEPTKVNIGIYYEYNEQSYIKTQDKDIVDGKTYYMPEIVNITPGYYGGGAPDTTRFSASTEGKYYLNIKNGQLYKSVGGDWVEDGSTLPATDSYMCKIKISYTPIIKETP